MIGAEIFVTVGSTAKKALLMEKYGIEDDHVFNSRDLSFAKGKNFPEIMSKSFADDSK